MCSHQASSSMGQTLDELEFERGLWSAACDGDLNKCKELLQRGHNPSKPDNSGFTPLHYAVRSASKELVECLLEAGSDVNAQTKAGKATALHRACSRGRPEIVELLISEYFSYYLFSAPLCHFECFRSPCISNCVLYKQRNFFGLDNGEGIHPIKNI